MRSLFLIVSLLLVFGTGCDSSEEVVVEGTYRATSFTLTEGGMVTDLLAAGGSLRLDLGSFDGTSGSFEGRLVAPDLGEGPISLAFDGTYTASTRGQIGRAPALDAVLTFDASADVFVTDAVWGLDGDVLSTTFPDDGGRDGLAVTLQRD